MSRKQLTTLISQSQNEVKRLTEGNVYGQNTRRINKLNETRIKMVNRLNEIKRGA